MKRVATILAAAALCAPASPAQAEDFGLKDLKIAFTGRPPAGAELGSLGPVDLRAGSHPFAFSVDLAVNTEADADGKQVPVGQVRNLRVELPVGLAGAPTATPRCSAVDFADITFPISGLPVPSCSDSSAIGRIDLEGTLPGKERTRLSVPIYSIEPPPGVAARLGFAVLGNAPVTVDVRIEEAPPYRYIAMVPNITQISTFYSAAMTLWGSPSDPDHNAERGICGSFIEILIIKQTIGGECPTSSPNLPLLTLPRSCKGPLEAVFIAESWLGERTPPETIQTQADTGEPRGPGACERLGFSPTISAQPTSRAAESPSGLDFDLDVVDPGLTDPAGIADSDIAKAVVTLPEGVTVNPSQAEGLGVCSEADLAHETATSAFGAGCPSAAKIGTVEAATPLLKGETLKGSLFVAEPYANRFGTLLAFYIVLKLPRLGIGIKLAGKVEPDPRSGQLVASVDDLPPQPFSHFHLRFREGGRSPLITPPLCGSYETKAVLTPSANPGNPLIVKDSFQITSGVGTAPCPPSGAPPFEPGFAAGTLNNRAGDFASLFMRLTRRDGDQDLTRFAAELPPGLVARLTGVERCPDAQIALARAKSGAAELASPSCPAGSAIGRVLAGAGVGSQLTYVSGDAYLAGPFNGAPFSVVGIVPALAGPFDVGTVVSRQALRVDPRNGRVRVDDAASDPIPHVLAGIPLRVRDVRVSVDRPRFTLNPTSCAPLEVAARLWGGGSDVFSTLDDLPVLRAVPFQAADCAALGFRPRLALRLRGRSTHRGGNPALRGVYRPRRGDANLRRLVLRLPRSAFLDQAHIRTICTRAQFAADRCPKGAIYGHARVSTPLLAEPLSGPIYLRSSNHKLPDLVADLHGLIDVEAVARIDSVRRGIRATFTGLPDAPISRAIVNMQGGRKGLIVNSANLCARQRRAGTGLAAHNGRSHRAKPLLRVSCDRRRKRRNHRR